MNKKYQVILSSTSDDLKEERTCVWMMFFGKIAKSVLSDTKMCKMI